MSEPDLRLGATRGAIAREMTRLFSAYYGHGPLRAKAYMTDDLVAVVFEQTFTRAERTLFDRGEEEAIKEIRRRFQQHMAEEFIAVVEEATGRSVKAFLSESDLEADVAVEIFLLADASSE
jgi:uncharacterized protein YbcI